MAFVLRALGARNNDRVHGVADENMNWDLNEDSKLNKEEMRAMKRADKAKYLRFIKADKDGDRVLDEDELQVAEEGERKHQSILRLRKLKAILKNRLNQRSAYWAFMFYTAFLALYLGLLYQQADVESAYSVTSTIEAALLPKEEATDDVEKLYEDKSAVFSWLRDTFGPIWSDPVCGDGECSSAEYPGFGRFGCIADCGTYEYLVPLEIQVKATNEHSIADFLFETSWNLCTRELYLPSKDVEECWFANFSQFKYDNGTMETYNLAVPGLNWYVKLNVPYGGTSGKVYSTSTEGSAVKDMIYSWGMCEVSGNLSCVPVVSTGGGSRVLPNFLVPKPSNDATDPVPIDDSVDRRRYIGGKNVVIGGLLMHQVRQAQDTCPGKFGSTREEESLSGEVWCQDPEHTDSSPFGVDPAFITTSTIGAGLQVHPNNYYENSEINSRGVPYGFYSVEFGRRETGFPILIDVNAEETAFNKVITYLEEGFYLDKYTKSLKVEILTYNADLRYFCRYVSEFLFTQAGSILVESTADAMDSQPYYYEKNDKKAENFYYVRRAFEAIFCVSCLFTFCIELFQLGAAMWKNGHPGAYFSSVWNYIELLSIAMHISAILLWILHVEAVRKFETKLRFDVYVDPLHRQEARFLQFAEEGSTLKYFVDNVMDDFVAILDSRGIYVTINGINIFLCLLRFFKAADFQPKLGIVTRTVGKSFQELAHFFALLSMVCLVYLIFGQVVFGDKVQQFSSLGQSAQTVIGWTLSGNDRGAGERLFELPGNLAVAGAVYYTTFAMITTLMLLNFLIAIFSEGYIRVQNDSHSTSSLVSELTFLVKGWIRAAVSQGKILNEKQLLKRVRLMIAAQETEMLAFNDGNLDAKELLQEQGEDDSDSDEEGTKMIALTEDGDVAFEVDELRRTISSGVISAKNMEDSKSQKKEASDVKKGLKHTSKKTSPTKDNSKKFTSGTQEIFDSVVNASYTKYKKPEIPQLDMKVAEMHSMMLVMCKQIAELKEDLVSAGGKKKSSAEELSRSASKKM